MEHLSKQQIVLLTLFTSFVTSIATGVVTVSLMDQDPGGVTQVINKVVERTIERVAVTPSGVPSTAAAADSLSLSDTVDKVSQSIVRIKTKGIGADGIMGLGIIISTDGLILTDKVALGFPEEGSATQEYVAVLSNGEEFPVRMFQSEILGDVAFAAMIVPETKHLAPVTLASPSPSMKLGDAVYALSGKVTSVLESGIIKKVSTTNEPLETSVSSQDLLVGSPLFTQKGDVIGFKTKSFLTSSSFYPLSALASVAPRISR